jgi:GT2 family glycosyltransferase
LETSEGGPKSAIIIPTYNGKRGLQRCLDSLRWADGVAAVIVVDAGSSDGTDRVAAKAPGVTLISIDPGKWWAGATNVGCSWAVSDLGADILCLLNHDCTWDEASYRHLLDAAMRQPLDIHCSRVVTTAPSRVLLAGGTTSWSGLLKMRGFGSSVSAPLPSCDVEWCGGMGVMIPAALWRDLGGFDEQRFPHYYADSDFCFRARGVGARVRYCSESTVANDRSTTGHSIPRQRASLGDLWLALTSRHSPQNIRDTIRFFSRHAGPRAPIAVAHMYALLTTMTLVRMARRG